MCLIIVNMKHNVSRVLFSLYFFFLELVKLKFLIRVNMIYHNFDNWNCVKFNSLYCVMFFKQFQVVVIAANMGCNVCQGRVSRVVSKMTGKVLNFVLSFNRKMFIYSNFKHKSNITFVINYVIYLKFWL